MLRSIQFNQESIYSRLLHVPIGDFYHPRKTNLVAEAVRDNPINVGDRVYTYRTGMDRSGTYPKGNRGYLGGSGCWS